MPQSGNRAWQGAAYSVGIEAAEPTPLANITQAAAHQSKKAGATYPALTNSPEGTTPQNPPPAEFSTPPRRAP